MNNPMMKCGHAANAINDRTGQPSCVICVGIDPGAQVVDDNPPSMEGRMARCYYYGGSNRRWRSSSSNYGCKRDGDCDCEQPSGTDLPFFEHKPNSEHDRFYCGCAGWD